MSCVNIYHKYRAEQKIEEMAIIIIPTEAKAFCTVDLNELYDY